MIVNVIYTMYNKGFEVEHFKTSNVSHSCILRSTVVTVLSF